MSRPNESARIEAHAERFLMPDVDAIIERLRAKACSPDEYRHWNYVEAVTLEQAEAAVLAAVDARTAEIVEALTEQADRCEHLGTIYSGTEILQGAADLIARRFPNGGTPNAS